MTTAEVIRSSKCCRLELHLKTPSECASVRSRSNVQAEYIVHLCDSKRRPSVRRNATIEVYRVRSILCGAVLPGYTHHVR